MQTKISFLLLGFFILVIGTGYLFSYVYGNSNILYFAVIFSVLMSSVSYWFSDKIILKMAKAREIKESENPEIYNILKNLCLKASLPLPKVYLIKEQQPNAFATGRNKNHAVVAVTEGLLAKLSRQELEGVIGHELSHIQNKDMLLQTMVVVLVGFISILSRWFLWGQIFGGRRNNQGGALAILGLAAAILAPLAAMLIQLAISRKREFLADASAAHLTLNPRGLALALEKIAADRNPMKTAQPATAHLYIVNPLKGGGIAKLFMTHPPVEERVKALGVLRI
ncbi:MAG: zinc metalloprotease HtpX [Candidatus Nealsonbacteria bacterium CG09_land_8_20_14_0_10_42_14]|uniref:Protease HtpX homolog n=1 Tax=Candidatus Nealsonbacteria bacterium CG09_land_8_20_14_0_10_42_14 TaxID=1974707 RepID=A0A2H0WWY8_9BACT|nr:MAG: zinc metalloprotease HtpX [Candidatus Nealsonbacteria bacterium CG09_land_8_20_14_0_10_42_14]